MYVRIYIYAFVCSKEGIYISVCSVYICMQCICMYVYLVCSVHVCMYVCSICAYVCRVQCMYVCSVCIYVCVCIVQQPRVHSYGKRDTQHTESSARLISRASRLARMLCWNAYKTGVTAHSGHQLERVSHTTPAASASGVPTSSTIVLQSPPRDILREDICYSQKLELSIIPI